MKKILALFLALATMLMLLNGCSKPTQNEDEPNTSESSTQTSEPADELKKYSVLGMQHQGFTDWEPDNVADFDVMKVFFDKAEEYGLDMEFEVISAAQWVATIQARIASDDFADLTLLNGLDNSTLIDLIKREKLYDIDSVLEYSDGTALRAWDTGGASFLRKVNTYTDGKVYFFRGMADAAPAFKGNVSNYHATLCWSPLIRKDWLENVNMDMPKTTDDVIMVLKAMQEADCNGNGVHDERMWIDLSTDYFKNGIAQWFGLANYMFQINEETGKAENPFFQEGFRDYVEFIRECVDNDVIYLSDNGHWSETGNNVSQNYVSIFTNYPDTQASTYLAGIDDNAQYQIMDPINGKEGIKPSIMVTASQEITPPWGFASTGDIESDAAFMDLIFSEWYHYWHNFGVEGLTYEFNDEGIPTTDWVYSVDYAKQTNGKVAGVYLVAYTILPYMAYDAEYLTYNGEHLLFDTPLDFKESNYFSDFLKEDYSKKNNELGYNNLAKALGYCSEYTRYGINPNVAGSVPMITEEENDIIAQYSTDLNTYCVELFADLISGEKSFDNWDFYVDQMNELGMQELHDLYQGLYDRFLGK